MTEFTWNTPTLVESVLTTELNSLGDASNKITTTAVDNDTTLDMYGDFILNLNTQGAARDSGAYVSLYILPRSDGDSYPYGGDSLTPASNLWVGNWLLDAATTAREAVVRGVLLPPEDFHVLVVNQTGQAFAATLNTVRLRRYNTQSV